MRLPKQLSAAQRRRFEETLTQSHLIRVRLFRIDNGQRTFLPTTILDGQVDVDYTAFPSRTLQLTAYDPDHSLHVDRDNPSDGSAFPGIELQVEYGVWVEADSHWVDVPVFTGPITGASRSGDVLSLTAGGREIYLAPPFGKRTKRLLTWKRGEQITDVLRAAVSGEGLPVQGIPDRQYKTKRAGSVVFGDPPDPQPAKTKAQRRQQAEHPVYGGDTTVWAMMKRFVSEMPAGHRSAWRVHFDGAGICRVEQKPKGRVWSFTDKGFASDGGWSLISGIPELTWSADGAVNFVLSTGFKKKGAKTHALVAHADADEILPNHPLAPKNLGTVSHPRYLPLFDSAPHIKTHAALLAHAREILRARLHESLDAKFEAHPVPHLEEGDSVGVRYDGVVENFPAIQFSIPLVPEGTMSIGYHKRVKVRGIRPHRGR